MELIGVVQPRPKGYNRMKDGMSQKRKRGRPPLDPEQKVPSNRQSISMPVESWRGLEELARAVRSLARRGSSYNKASWRTLIRMLADDGPRLAKQIEQIRKLGHTGTFRLTIDFQSGFEPETTPADTSPSTEEDREA